MRALESSTVRALTQARFCNACIAMKSVTVPPCLHIYQLEFDAPELCVL